VHVNAAAFAENRAGRLTTAQVDEIRAYHRGKRSRDLPVAALMVLIVVLGGSRAFGASTSHVQDLGIAAAVIGVLAVVIVAIWNMFALATDVAQRQVRSVEGTVRPERRTTRGSSMYFINVNGKRLTSTRPIFDTVVPMQMYRVYFLPRSNLVVNLEVL
jgi:hypothetical protein